MITIIYQFKHNVTRHCRINQFFSFPEQLQIWIYVFLVGDHRYVLLLFASKEFDRICYSGLFNIFLDKEECPPHCTIAMLYVSQSCLFCKMEQQKIN